MTTKNVSNCTNGCNRKIYSQGLCQSCHKKKYGRKFNTIQESYFAKVIKSQNENDCWDWKAQKDSNGYGRISFRGYGRSVLAHTVSFFIYNGYWSELDVLHHCDNPSCTNPKHLFEGTHQDNMRDRDEKGRCQKGESHYLARLTIDDVVEIKKRLAAGERNPSIARMFNVCDGTISAIKNRRTWNHVNI